MHTTALFAIRMTTLNTPLCVCGGRGGVNEVELLSKYNDNVHLRMRKSTLFLLGLLANRILPCAALSTPCFRWRTTDTQGRASTRVWEKKRRGTKRRKRTRTVGGTRRRGGAEARGPTGRPRRGITIALKFPPSFFLLLFQSRPKKGTHKIHIDYRLKILSNARINPLLR